MRTKTKNKYLREIEKSNKIIVPKNIRENCKENFLEVKIETDDKEKCFITSVNRRITIRKQIREYLGVNEGDVVAVEFSNLERTERTDELFKNNKVDLLTLIPEETTKGHEIIITEFKKESESFLRIWSPAGTKGARQIELKRFVDKRALGEILGQYQAEGEKAGEFSRIVFTNKLVAEHRDFIENLEDLGLDRALISVQCVYNQDLISKDRALSRCGSFEQKLGVEVEKFVPYNKSRGPLAFRSKFYNVLFSEILFNSMNKFRENISQEINCQNKVLGEGFLAKLLTGDGTLDATISDSRTYGSPSINVRVVDEDLSALKDYKNILSNFGFQPFINEEHIYARSSCSLENLLFLYKIEAFKNTRNWRQLAITIMLILEGRRYSTYKRFIDFLGVEKITSGVVKERYEVGHRAAQEWLENKVDEGLLEVHRESPYPKLYELTDKGKEFSKYLADITNFSENIKQDKEVKSYEKALEALKDDIRT